MRERTPMDRAERTPMRRPALKDNMLQAAAEATDMRAQRSRNIRKGTAESTVVTRKRIDNGETDAYTSYGRRSGWTPM